MHSSYSIYSNSNNSNNNSSFTLSYYVKKYSLPITFITCTGLHGPHRRRAVAVGSGADGVALDHFLIFLFHFTYLFISATRRVDRRKARLISSRNEEVRPVASVMVLLLLLMFVSHRSHRLLLNVRRSDNGFGTIELIFYYTTIFWLGQKYHIG